MCVICSGHDYETLKEKFYSEIKELDGKIVGEYEAIPW